MKMSSNSLRNRVVSNVLRRSKPFTSSQISRVTRVSGRHTRRVLLELVEQQLLTRLINGGSVSYIVS